MKSLFENQNSVFEAEVCAIAKLIKSGAVSRDTCVVCMLDDLVSKHKITIEKMRDMGLITSLEELELRITNINEIEVKSYLSREKTKKLMKIFNNISDAWLMGNLKNKALENELDQNNADHLVNYWNVKGAFKYVGKDVLVAEFKSRLIKKINAISNSYYARSCSEEEIKKYDRIVAKRIQVDMEKCNSKAVIKFCGYVVTLQNKRLLRLYKKRETDSILKPSSELIVGNFVNEMRTTGLIASFPVLRDYLISEIIARLCNFRCGHTDQISREIMLGLIEKWRNDELVGLRDAWQLKIDIICYIRAALENVPKFRDPQDDMANQVILELLRRRDEIPSKAVQSYLEEISIYEITNALKNDNEEILHEVAYEIISDIKGQKLVVTDDIRLQLNTDLWSKHSTLNHRYNSKLILKALKEEMNSLNAHMQAHMSKSDVYDNGEESSDDSSEKKSLII